MLTALSVNLLPLQKPLLDSRLASCHLKTFIVFHGFSSIFMDFHGFSKILIDFHVFLWIFMDLHGFSQIFIDFHIFRSMDAYGLKRQPAAPIETFARFRAGFLSSEDFHRISQIFIVFHRFSQIFIDFHIFRSMDA